MQTYSVTLNQGKEMPIIGLGTWLSEPFVVGRAVVAALEAGYRHIDCAAVYGNEKEIGEALRSVFAKGKIKREDVFITSKLWNTNHQPEHVLPALKQTLSDLRLDYLDLYLMHFPVAMAFQGIPAQNDVPKDPENKMPKFDTTVSIRQTWQAMEQLVGLGLTKAIGVSNFRCVDLLDLLSYAKIVPAVNQVEHHPLFVRPDLVRLCHSKGIVFEAYSPFGSAAAGEKSPLRLPQIAEIAKKHGKTPAQVILRWDIQRGVPVIPKSTNEERLRENLGALEFKLSEEELDTINKLDRGLLLMDTRKFWGFAITE